VLDMKAVQSFKMPASLVMQCHVQEARILRYTTAKTSNLAQNVQ